jgi:sugar phosphate isomerase/epimerase
VREEYGIPLMTSVADLRAQQYDAIVRIVDHACFAELDLAHMQVPGGVYYDLKRSHVTPEDLTARPKS